MRRRGPQKHATAKIAKAIMQHEAGTPLAEVARQHGVSKSVVKYWIDHAEKFVPEVVHAKRAPAVAKLLRRGELMGWRKFVQLISLSKKAIDEMDGCKRIETAEKLKNILVSLAGRGMQTPGSGPMDVIELSEKKARLIVQDWFEENNEDKQRKSSDESHIETAAEPEEGKAGE